MAAIYLHEQPDGTGGNSVHGAMIEGKLSSER
jgi:hypothetical protein